MSATEIVEPGMSSTAELERVVRDHLAAWHERASVLWDLTAEIGHALQAAHRQVPSEDWPTWLDNVGLTPFQAFLFMRAHAYPQLMREHRPEGLDAIRRLLPQGQGEAYDREQAELACRLHEGGMNRTKLRIHLGVSHATVARWLDPDRYQEQQRKKAERRQRQIEAADAAKRAQVYAALKAKGGPASFAYEHIRKAAVALTEAHDAASGDARRALSAALAGIYAAEDKIKEANGLL